MFSKTWGLFINTINCRKFIFHIIKIYRFAFNKIRSRKRRQAVHQFLKSGYAQLRSALEIEAQTGVDRRRLVDPRLVDLLT